MHPDGRIFALTARRPLPTPAALAAGIVLTLTALAVGGAGQPRTSPPRWEYAAYFESPGGVRQLVRGGQEVRGAEEVAGALGIDERHKYEQGLTLDALGASGWELVDVQRSEHGDTLQFRFKRPL